MNEFFAFELRDYEYDHRPTKPLTQILKDYNVGISTKNANRILVEKGILEEKIWPWSTTTKGGVKKYLALTKVGLLFGKCGLHPQKRELVPRYYVDMEDELVKIIRGKGGLM